MISNPVPNQTAQLLRRPFALHRLTPAIGSQNANQNGLRSAAVLVAGRTVAVITSCDVTGLLLGIDLIGVPENVQVVPVGRPEQDKLIEFGN
jgi:hypothetical protein